MEYINKAGTSNSVRHFFARYCIIICLIIFFVILSACDQKKLTNVIIVTFDTTRADYISVYGKSDANTPNLENLAKDGVIYERAISSIPITLPSHSTIMTGKSPFVHGVRDNGLFVLPEQQLTIAEILKANGYKTAAAIGSFPLTSQFGINQGFNFFNEHITLNQEDMYGDKSIPKDALFFDERTSTQVNDAIMPWIEKNHKDPFFVWFHYFDPHQPHEPPAPYDQNFINDLYQGEIAYADESLGNVIAQLKRLGVYDNSLIIFTSDHGEGIGEHKEQTHSMLIYNTTQHVPLIVKYPNQANANKRIKTIVGLVDIFPTIISVLGLDLNQFSDIQGHTLPIKDSDAKHYEIYMETLSAKLSNGWGEQRGLIKDDYKYIYGPEKELYNLANDPHELNNLIESKPELAHSMKVLLQDYLDENKPENVVNSISDMNPKTLNILRGLGYIQSTKGVTEEIQEVLNDSGDAPQDHVESISFHSAAKQLLFKQQYLEALRYIEALLESEPNNLSYIELKIQTDMALGNIQSVKTALEKLPTDTYGTLTAEKRLEILARIALLENNTDKAKVLLMEASAISSTPSIEYELSKIAVIEQQFEVQQSHLLKILKLVTDTKTVIILNELAISYARDGDMLNAEKYFLKAINQDPYNTETYYNYGVYLISVFDFNTAISQFKQAIELEKESPDAYLGIIESYLAIDEKELAQVSYKELLLVAPNSLQVKKADKLLKGLEL